MQCARLLKVSACRRKTATVTFTYYERVKKVCRNTSYDRNKSPAEPAVNHLKTVILYTLRRD